MDVFLRHLVRDLAGDSARLGYLLRFEPLPLEHIIEIHVPAEVELIGAVDVHSTIPEEPREHPVGYGGTYLALDIVAQHR